MSENLQKLIGVVVMAVLVVVGVAVSSGDDTDFSRNRSFRDNPATFAGADRVEEADCCDENAYRISQLEKQVSSLEAELAEVQQLQPSIVSFLNAFSPGQGSPELQEAAENVWDACKGGPLGPNYIYWAQCYGQNLVGLEIGFAKALVALDQDGAGASAAPKFAVFHRASKTDNQSPEVITTEACAPIFMNGHQSLLALDTVGGVVAHSTNFSFSKAVYKEGKWEEYVSQNEVC